MCVCVCVCVCVVTGKEHGTRLSVFCLQESL